MWFSTCLWCLLEPSYHRTRKATIYRTGFALRPRPPSFPATRILLITSKRMSDTHPRDTSSEVVRSQPQPSMSTTSSQYRNAAQTPSHYQDFSTSNHDPLYGLGAWQQHHAPSHDSYAAGPSTAQFVQYPAVGVDSVGTHPQSAPTAWSGYVRQAPLEWQHAGPEQNYTTRSTVPYCDAEGSASVPHQIPTIPRHYQHQHQYQHQPALDLGHALPLASQDHVFRSTERFNELRVSSVSAHKQCCALH